MLREAGLEGLEGCAAVPLPLTGDGPGGQGGRGRRCGRRGGRRCGSWRRGSAGSAPAVGEDERGSAEARSDEEGSLHFVFVSRVMDVAATVPSLPVVPSTDTEVPVFRVVRSRVVAASALVKLFVDTAVVVPSASLR